MPHTPQETLRGRHSHEYEITGEEKRTRRPYSSGKLLNHTSNRVCVCVFTKMHACTLSVTICLWVQHCVRNPLAPQQKLLTLVDSFQFWSFS